MGRRAAQHARQLQTLVRQGKEGKLSDRVWHITATQHPMHQRTVPCPF